MIAVLDPIPILLAREGVRRGVRLPPPEPPASGPRSPVRARLAGALRALADRLDAPGPSPRMPAGSR